MTFSSSRNRQLDLLRGLAVLLVLGRHMPNASTWGGTPLAFFCLIWRRVGWMGVDLFFVLSGFLVSGLLFTEYQKTGALESKRFLLRRGMRIWPAFYLMTAISLVFVWRTTKPHQVLLECFFLQNYFPLESLWPHTWSLAIEEHFYIGLALVLGLLARSGRRNPFSLIPALWMTAAIGCLYGRVMSPYDVPGVFTPTHVRMDALLFGVLLSYLYHFHRSGLEKWVRRLWPLMTAAAIAALWPIFTIEVFSEPFLPRFGLTLTYLAFGIILLLALLVWRLPAKESLPERALSFIGVRSYSIYLWHYPVAWLFAQPMAIQVGDPHPLKWAVSFYLGGSLVAGWLCYEFFEKPILRWRDKRFPSSAKAIV